MSHLSQIEYVLKTYLASAPEQVKALEGVVQDVWNHAKTLSLPVSKACRDMLTDQLSIVESQYHSSATRTKFDAVTGTDIHGPPIHPSYVPYTDEDIAARATRDPADGIPTFLMEHFKKQEAERIGEALTGITSERRHAIAKYIGAHHIGTIGEVVREAAALALQDEKAREELAIGLGSEAPEDMERQMYLTAVNQTAFELSRILKLKLSPVMQKDVGYQTNASVQSGPYTSRDAT